MTDLIRTLEQAEEGSRELDALVGQVVGCVGKSKNVYRRNRYPLQLLRVETIYPPYTTSVDAALTLVPKGWSSEISCVGRFNDVTLSDRDPQHPRCKSVMAEGRTFALAICIAALRARDGGGNG